MTNIDWICCAILLIFSIIGFRRGLAGELFRIFAVILGLGGGFAFSDRLFQLIIHSVPRLSFTGMRVFIFILIFSFFAGIAILAGMLFSKLIRLTPLGWFDRIGGAVIGGLKGFMLLGLILWLLLCFPSLSTAINLDKTKIAGKTQVSISAIRHAADIYFKTKAAAITKAAKKD
jgi:membrane protein required for colicin V production